MQGYDSVAMDVDGEIGGNDQTFNMLCGRDLMKTMKNKEKFVITMKLLEDNSGKKMGKTEGNMVALSDTANEMFGKVMSWTDGLIIPGFELCTNISTEEIEKIKNSLESNLINPKEMKIKLAKEVVTTFFGEKKATEAGEVWENTFSKKEIPTEVETLSVKEGTAIVDILLNNKIVSSKSEFRRLVEEGAVTNMDTNEKVITQNEIVKSGVYRIGKKRFCKIRISS